MNWLTWAILSAGFAGLTAILAKVGVKDVDFESGHGRPHIRDPGLRVAGRFPDQSAITGNRGAETGFFSHCPVWRPEPPGFAISGPCSLESTEGGPRGQAQRGGGHGPGCTLPGRVPERIAFSRRHADRCRPRSPRLCVTTSVVGWRIGPSPSSDISLLRAALFRIFTDASSPPLAAQQ